jgi:hypothetical protein
MGSLECCDCLAMLPRLEASYAEVVPRERVQRGFRGAGLVRSCCFRVPAMAEVTFVPDREQGSVCAALLPSE